jgi:hypothetical protein
MAVWWLSNTSMTVRVVVNEHGAVVESAPIVQKFIGQPLQNLTKWMNRRPGFTASVIGQADTATSASCRCSPAPSG